MEAAYREVLPYDPSAKSTPPASSKKVRTKSRRIPSSTVSVSAHLKVTATPVIEALNVAEVRSETPFMDIGSTQPAFSGSPSASFKKKVAFVKLSEPARVAVSFFSLTFCECDPNSSGGHRPERANLGIVFAADSHGQLVQVTQEIAAECPVSGLAEAVTGQTSGDEITIAVIVFLSLSTHLITTNAIVQKLLKAH